MEHCTHDPLLRRTYYAVRVQVGPYSFRTINLPGLNRAMIVAGVRRVCGPDAVIIKVGPSFAACQRCWEALAPTAEEV